MYLALSFFWGRGLRITLERKIFNKKKVAKYMNEKGILPIHSLPIGGASLIYWSQFILIYFIISIVFLE